MRSPGTRSGSARRLHHQRGAAQHWVASQPRGSQATANNKASTWHVWKLAEKWCCCILMCAFCCSAVLQLTTCAHQSQPAFAAKAGEHSTAINLVVHVQAPPAHWTLSVPPLMSCHALLGLGQSSQPAPPALPLRWQLHAACLRVTRCRYSATHTSDSLTVPQCNKMWLPCWAQDLAIACPRVHTHAGNICTNQTSAEQTASPARRSAATSLHACRRPSAASSSLASASQRS